MESKLYSVPNPSKYEIRAEAKAMKNAKCPPPQACILLVNLHCLQIKLQANTIQQSSGAGMKLFNVRGAKVIPESDLKQVPQDFNEANNFMQHSTGDPQSVIIKDNYILDFNKGVGIILD